MPEAVSQRLTGGTFMVLLERARPTGGSRRSSISGEPDRRNNRELLGSLIRLADEAYQQPPESTFKQNTSEYRACKLAQGTYLPFDQQEFVAGFDTAASDALRTALDRTADFVDQFIDVENKGGRLVQRLIGLIEADDTIPDGAVLSMRPEGQSLAKSELAGATTVCIEALLLGVWHYIVTQVPDNTLGRPTFELWHHKPATTGAPWKLDDKQMPAVTQNIEATRVRDIPASPEPDSVESEILEAEFVVDDGEPGQERTGAPEPPEPSFVFNQFGANGTQVAHVENLYIGGGQ